MALVKTDNTILSIRGRFGGVYFKTGPDGQHVQAWPRNIKYTRSNAQMGSGSIIPHSSASGIAGYSAVAYLFGLACIAAFALIWAAFGLAYLFLTKGRELKHITGYNWFMHYGLAYPEENRPPYFRPPHSPSERPSFIALYKDEWTYHHAPEDWPDECPSNNYYEWEIYNDRLSYRADEGKWSIWWKDPVWVISPGTGWEPAGKTFYSPGGLITDYYLNPVTGSKTHVFLGRLPI